MGWLAADVDRVRLQNNHTDEHLTETIACENNDMAIDSGLNLLYRSTFFLTKGI